MQYINVWIYGVSTRFIPQRFETTAYPIWSQYQVLMDIGLIFFSLDVILYSNFSTKANLKSKKKIFSYLFWDRVSVAQVQPQAPRLKWSLHLSLPSSWDHGHMPPRQANFCNSRLIFKYSLSHSKGNKYFWVENMFKISKSIPGREGEDKFLRDSFETHYFWTGGFCAVIVYSFIKHF